MARHGLKPSWWRTPVDIAVLARGFVVGQGISDNPYRGTDRLSAQCGWTHPQKRNATPRSAMPSGWCGGSTT